MASCCTAGTKNKPSFFNCDRQNKMHFVFKKLQTKQFDLKKIVELSGQYHCSRICEQAEIHKKFQLKINQKKIHFPRRWGPSAKYMHNTVAFTELYKERSLVASSCWMTEMNELN